MSAEPLHVSPALVLAVTPRGIQPPRPNVPPEEELVGEGLEWHPADTPVLGEDDLHALAAIDATGAPPPGADLSRLVADGWVRPGPADPPTATAAPGPTPPAAPGPAVPVEGWLRLPHVLTCALRRGRFIFHDQHGRPVAALDADELALLAGFATAATLPTAVERWQAVRPRPAADPTATIAGFVAAGLLVPADVEAPVEAPPEPSTTAEPTGGWTSARRLVDQMDAADAAYRAARGLTGREPRPAVVPVSHTAPIFDRGWHIVSPNLGLGLIFAYADVHEGGRLHDRYDFTLQWMPRRRTIKRILAEHGPSVFLFSNYLWSLSENLEVSALVKELSPESVTVHGGPSTPKYDADTARFLARHPHVDVAVRGEGELTTAELLDALDGRVAGRLDRPDRGLAPLRDVAGLTYRSDDGPVRTPDRDRFAELDAIPSPYLTGLFDGYANGAARFVILESNRGCPYGCTFCDWGSATLSRIRKFDHERVDAELEWCARNQVSTLLLADANFGIFPRDVEIAQRIVDLKQRFGYPLAVTICFAKNTAKYLQPIIQLFIDNGILTEGNLALQSTDAGTLATIARKNIKTETYVQVAEEFRQAGLPLITDLIIGLPGSTVDSFAEDLQFCIDNQVTSRMVRLEVLVNSPMNDPAYRSEHRIVPVVEPADITGGRRALVLSTATYTRADLGRMLRLRDIMTVAENVGLYRHAALWVHHVTGRREIDLYRLIDDRCRAEPERWPLLLWSLRHLVHLAVPPLSWPQLHEEFGRFLVEEAGAPPGSALDTVLAVCTALAPALHRPFPETVALPHDYAAWYHEAFAARRRPGGRWREEVPPLDSFGPGTLTVSDPLQVTGLIDGSRPVRDGETVDWELRSEVSRSAAMRHIEHTPEELRRRVAGA